MYILSVRADNVNNPIHGDIAGGKHTISNRWASRSGSTNIEIFEVSASEDQIQMP